MWLGFTLGSAFAFMQSGGTGGAIWPDSLAVLPVFLGITGCKANAVHIRKASKNASLLNPSSRCF